MKMETEANAGQSIVTITGEFSPEELGICSAHNHVWIDLVVGAAKECPVLKDQPAILKELCEYLQSDGDALAECQPGGYGRNGNKLLELSQSSGVKMIACNGFHCARYYPEEYWMWKASAGKITNYFVNEIRESLAEARALGKPVQVGFIKIACKARLSQTPQTVLEAAADAVAETGSAIEVHTEKGAEAEKIIVYLNHHKVPSGRIVLCHMDKRSDFTFHCELAQSGILLEYDTLYRPKYDPEHKLWPLIEKMSKEGYCEYVALATHMAEPTLWRYQGGVPGLAGFPGNIWARRRQMGLEEKCINSLIEKNITRRLARFLPN